MNYAGRLSQCSSLECLPRENYTASPGGRIPRRPPEYDLVTAVRTRRHPCLGHILRMPADRLVRRVVLALGKRTGPPYQPGRLLMDTSTPYTNCIVLRSAKDGHETTNLSPPYKKAPKGCNSKSSSYLARALSTRPPMETEHCYSHPPQLARETPTNLLNYTGTVGMRYGAVFLYNTPVTLERDYTEFARRCEIAELRGIAEKTANMYKQFLVSQDGDVTASLRRSWCFYVRSPHGVQCSRRVLVGDRLRAHGVLIIPYNFITSQQLHPYPR